MPFYKELKIKANVTAYFWKISEDIDWLFENVQLNEKSVARLETMSSIEHKKGFLAVRMLLQHLGFTDFDLFYDESGKPHLKDKRENAEDKSFAPELQHPTSSTQLQTSNIKHISISHSHEFSCICISKKECIGIDLEKVKEKVLRIAPRFMDLKHLEGLSTEEQMQKATVVWGVKESVFKVKNEVGISFPDHISETTFELSDKKGKAQLNFNNCIEEFEFVFEFVDDYGFVCVLNSK